MSAGATGRVCIWQGFCCPGVVPQPRGSASASRGSRSFSPFAVSVLVQCREIGSRHKPKLPRLGFSLFQVE